jgi:aryl-alcohol dehydrogenase-like predicted oxidoreductase
VKKHRLGKSGLEVSALAMGSDLIGSKIAAQDAFRLFDFYHSRGGNFIDTANMYACWLPGFQGGESETTIGAWMKERGNRSKLVVSSKLAFDYGESKGGLTAAEIVRECERSLKRLQTDYLDLYYAHRDDREVGLEETMKAFDGLVKAGKVRAIGASNVALWRIAEANQVARQNGWAEYSVVQQRYTYLRPRHGADFGPQIFISEELKDFARSHGVGLVGYSILLQGAYVRADREIPVQFAGPDSDDRLAELRKVAAEVGCTPPQAIIAWMRQSDPAVLPIIAGSKVEQLQENIAGLEVRLSAEQMKRLDAAGNSSEGGWIQPT